ncbi:hypothetical protein ECEC1850_3574, partial [Escherichia coli EC1850]
MSCPSIWA